MQRRISRWTREIAAWFTVLIYLETFMEIQLQGDCDPRKWGQLGSCAYGKVNIDDECKYEEK